MGGKGILHTLNRIVGRDEGRGIVNMIKKGGGEGDVIFGGRDIGRVPRKERWCRL